MGKELSRIDKKTDMSLQQKGKKNELRHEVRMKLAGMKIYD